MKNNRLYRRDIDKIRRRLDLILKDCSRYMKKEYPEYYKTFCIRLQDFSGEICDKNPPCDIFFNHEMKLLSLLRFVGIFNAGVRPPTIPKDPRQLRGRIRIVPAPKIKNYRLTSKEKSV